MKGLPPPGAPDAIASEPETGRSAERAAPDAVARDEQADRDAQVHHRVVLSQPARSNSMIPPSQASPNSVNAITPFASVERQRAAEQAQRQQQERAERHQANRAGRIERLVAGDPAGTAARSSPPSAARKADQPDVGQPASEHHVRAPDRTRQHRVQRARVDLAGDGAHGQEERQETRQEVDGVQPEHVKMVAGQRQSRPVARLNGDASTWL